jgi:hypothetical protein
MKGSPVWWCRSIDTVLVLIARVRKGGIEIFSLQPSFDWDCVESFADSMGKFRNKSDKDREGIKVPRVKDSF